MNNIKKDNLPIGQKKEHQTVKFDVLKSLFHCALNKIKKEYI
jgi:hypothetical protein